MAPQKAFLQTSEQYPRYPPKPPRAPAAPIGRSPGAFCNPRQTDNFNRAANPEHEALSRERFALRFGVDLKTSGPTLSAAKRIMGVTGEGVWRF
jgi:hypothetical protein